MFSLHTVTYLSTQTYEICSLHCYDHNNIKHRCILHVSHGKQIVYLLFLSLTKIGKLVNLCLETGIIESYLFNIVPPFALLKTEVHHFDTLLFWYTISVPMVTCTMHFLFLFMLFG